MKILKNKETLLFGYQNTEIIPREWNSSMHVRLEKAKSPRLVPAGGDPVFWEVTYN